MDFESTNPPNGATEVSRRFVRIFGKILEIEKQLDTLKVQIEGVTPADMVNGHTGMWYDALQQHLLELNNYYQELRIMRRNATSQDIEAMEHYLKKNVRCQFYDFRDFLAHIRDLKSDCKDNFRLLQRWVRNVHQTVYGINPGNPPIA